MAEVTVVIPNYNGIGYLKDCLDTLREQTCKNYETVLVDNGSTDGSLAFVKEHYPWVKILALDRNYGFCHAVNAGIRAAESSYVFLLNNDTKLHEDCIEELLIMMRQHPHCFSCSARMITSRTNWMMPGIITVPLDGHMHLEKTGRGKIISSREKCLQPVAELPCTAEAYLRRSDGLMRHILPILRILMSATVPRSMAMRTGTVRGQSYGMSEAGRADQDTMSLKYAILRETMFI